MTSNPNIRTMKKRIGLIGCILFFGFQVLAQGEDISKPCAGTLINGVCWAKYDVDKPGRFANAGNPYGMLYQWNRKKGWPNAGADKTNWNNTPESGDFWETVNDPCPLGWRIPSIEEWNKLLDYKAVKSEFTSNGRMYVNRLTNDTLYFYFAGHFDGTIYETTSYYWSNSFHYALRAYEIQSSVVPFDPAMGISVRCVADETACDLVVSISETVCEKELPYRWRDTTFDVGTKTGEYCFRRTCKETGCDSIVYLYLIIDTLCEIHCPGVLMNGICWARSNVDKPGFFASAPESDGMYYQWNRRKGWPGEKPGADWDESFYTAASWEKENDPCPVGWRVPSIEEMRTLLDVSRVGYIKTQLNGVTGIAFTNKSSGSSLFFPHAGSIDSHSGNGNRWHGYYWSNTPNTIVTQNSVWCLDLIETPGVTGIFQNIFGFSVRCVADVDVPRCDDIITDTFLTIGTNDLPYEWCDTIFGIGTKSGIYHFQRISTVTGCDSIVNLHLTVERPCPGVLINGICWAKYNVDEPGRFANPGNSYGMLYQWNRRKGWPAMYPDTVAGWDSSLEPGDTWEAANDPCPVGWRMPTVEEMKTLLDRTKVNKTETAQDRWVGTRYTDIATGNAIFLPAVSYRDEHGVTHNIQRKEYWSSSNHWAIWDNHILRQQPYAHGYSVRCVADENACHIVLTASENICKENLPYTWHDTTFSEGTRTGEYRIRRTNLISGCDTIFDLYLTVDTLCGKPCKERGVLINGVCWAESNVDSPNTFANTPESFGLLYQWNWKKGHPLKGDIDFDDWGNHYNDPSWEAVNNPCPADWRIPNIGEIYTLLDDLKVTHEWTQQNGVSGMRFTDKINGNAVFLPAAGHRLYPFDYDTNTTGGNYWSTTKEYDNKAVYALSFFYSGIYTIPLSDNAAWSVRCVAGRDTTGCKTIVTDTIIDICEKDLPYEWEGTGYTKLGIYRFQHISAVSGCDSIVRLHLNVHQPEKLFFSDAICYGSTYHNHGFNLSAVTADTIVSDTLQTRWGCDSVRTLSLIVHPVYYETFYDTICQGDAYNRYGFQLPSGTIGGTFTATYPTIHGCDSTVTLHLYVSQTYLFPESGNLCQGDTIDFRGRRLYESGVYDDTLTTVHGCDSIFRLTLTVHPVYNLSFSDAVCYGNDYHHHGFDLSAITADTIVSDTLQTRWGCDSIRTLSLTVHPLYETPLFDTVCQGEPYYKHGFRLTQVMTDGLHRLSLLSQDGCDSVLFLHLTVLPVFHPTVYDSVCPSKRYDKHGFHLSDIRTSNSFRLPLQNQWGCDSIITLELYVYPTYLHPRPEYICEGDTIDFRGRRLYESGIYYDSLRTVHGCDSIFSLDLTVHPVYDMQFSGVLCEGSPYTGYGFSVTEPGVHQHRLTSIHGCDSIVTLTLTEEKKVQGSIGLLLDDCSTHGYSFFFDPQQQIIDTWQWEMGDGTVYRSEEGFHQYADSGVYRIRLRTETANGCKNRFSHVQRVPPYLSHVPIYADRQVIDEDYPTVHFRTEVLPDMECVWEFGDGTTVKGDSITHTFDATTRKYYDVTLKVWNADSCITENSIRIEVLFLPKPVNTFSPNGDGINDVFMADYRVEITDRNGLRIYSGDNGWDGSYKGKQAPEDTYFYKLYYRTANGERMKTGYITLIR